MSSETWVFRLESPPGESLGHFLARFRRANYLSHKALAEHLGVPVKWVQDWETPSRRRNPTSLQLIALSKLVEVETKQLALMLPPMDLHLLPRLCAACYRERPIHQALWQQTGTTRCQRHGLDLLSVCPVCGTCFELPALWEKGCCRECEKSFEQMVIYQQPSR
ncbi:helix-turn-helix domain-containing protein [Planktothrix sp. FACHB-1355]|uniref:helix-turn-helix domain-containing protein n=1 Tax=Planktothrix sp. FACHB-1355 TaxID=2692854 RepID=UPI00168BD3F1|nr:helix-turn-helix domain-containing protein [Planktothrix sp. FACHB-1355]MBD3557323.1 helix-turn-helix domain-containing protein [Planktothrix sp. FACHB-1355]